MALKEYNKKRNFKRTSEPAGKKAPTKKSGGIFVVQKHEASHLHYDFRIEMDGVLKSWAVPKGPSLNPADKRLAVQVEDHPLDYGSFEGTIPQGEYGGGTVMLWDRGEWEPLEGNPRKQLHDGSMKISLHGERLNGGFALVQMKDRDTGEPGRNWLLIKEKDDQASKGSITKTETTSVSTGRTMDEIARGDAGKKARPRKKAAANKTPRAKTAKIEADETTKLSEVPGARKATFPKVIKPQLATLAEYVPSGEKWVHEVKYDGYRFVAFIDRGRVTLITRNGNDWTAKFPAIVKELGELPVKSAVLDGELVALGDNGKTDFQLLQNSIKGMADAELVYYLFDLLYLDGYSVKASDLLQRKALLNEMLGRASQLSLLRYSEHFAQQGEQVWSKACELGLEGIICKDTTAPYVERRSRDWLKVKCTNRQEFVIGGFSKPAGSRSGFGALLLGIRDSKSSRLKYAGKVGTGFTSASLKELHTKMKSLARDESPFVNTPRESWVKGVTWIEPRLVAEVSYVEITKEGLLRHSVFHGLREDKTQEDVILEKPTTVKQASKPAKKARVPKTSPKGNPEELKLSNPGRVLYPENDITKADLAKYYAAVGDRMAPWALNRPLSIVRCPDGRDKQCFFQRHSGTVKIPTLESIDVKGKDTTETYFYISGKSGLTGLVQNSVLEIHGWQCAADDMDHPDRIIFDIDPDEGVTWARVVKTAGLLRDVLKKCGFVPFVMTTGGKGLHVVVPLKPSAGWDEVVQFSRAVAAYFEAQHPDDYTATMSKAKRKGKLFIDAFRNNESSTAILPYSTRAREGATVATPVTWEELSARLNPKKFTVKTVPSRIARQKQDPWAAYSKSRKPLVIEKVLKKLQSSGG